MNATATRPVAPSPEQVQFLKDLIADVAEYAPSVAASWRETLNEGWRRRTLVGGRGNSASTAIDALKALRKGYRSGEFAPEEGSAKAQEKAAKKSVAVREPRPEVPAGRYAVETDEGHLAFYLVRVSDKGSYTVKVYASDDLHDLPSWKAQLGVLRKIEADGVEEAGLRFGKEARKCRRCGKRLTVEQSRDQGYGPDCIKKI